MTDQCKIRFGASVICALVTAAVLAGCGVKPPTCGDEPSLSLVREVVLDEIAASDKQPSQDPGWSKAFKTNSKIDFLFVRTTSQDEKIGKVNCASTMVTTFPEGARTWLSNTLMPDAFRKDYPGLNMKIDGLKLSADIQYSSQMTDDKKSLLVEVQGFRGVVEVASLAGRYGNFKPKVVVPEPSAAIAAPATTVTETLPTAAPQAAQSVRTTTDGVGTIDWSRYVGKSTFGLLADVGVTAKLKDLLGKDYAAFNERMGVSGDVGQDAGYLWSTGLMPHEGGSEEAGFAVNIKTGEVVALMLVGGKQYKFFGVSKPAGLPLPLLDWYKQRNETQ